MTKRVQDDYNKLVKLIALDVKKSIRGYVKKLIREEVKYAFSLLNEVKQVTPILEANQNPTAQEAKTKSTTERILEKYKTDLSNNASNLVPTTIRVGGVDVPIETSANNSVSQNTVTLQGHEKVANSPETAEFAVKLQTKDYSKVMKKILNSDNK